MAIGVLEVSPDLVFSFCKALIDSPFSFKWRVERNPLPADAIFVGCRLVDGRFMVEFESSSVERDGDIVPSPMIDSEIVE